MTPALREQLLDSWPRFGVFIESHIVRLAAQGKLRQAYRTKLRTITDHERRLEIYQSEARTLIERNRVQSFQGEINRLKDERDIIKAAIDFLGIQP